MFLVGQNTDDLPNSPNFPSPKFPAIWLSYSLWTYVGVTGGRATVSARDAIKQFSVKLIQQLPIENDIFFAMAKQNGLFPLDIGDSIAAKSTRAKKVAYFLQYVVEPGAEEYLPKLLKVMQESEVANIVRLADEIQAATGIGMYTYVCKSLT